MARPTLAIALAFLCAVAAAQDATCLERDVLTVTGVSVRSTPSTIAVVSLAVQSEGTTTSDVQAAIAEGSASLLAYLRAQNVTTLETSGVSLNPNRDFSQQPPTITGYSGRNAVTFETGIDESGPILDGAVAAGASEINGVSFKGTNEATVQARSEAIADAVAGATAEAEAAAMVVGKALGEAVNVLIADRFRPQPRPSAGGAQSLARSAADESAPSEIVRQDVNVSASVTITFIMG